MLNISPKVPARKVLGCHPEVFCRVLPALVVHVLAQACRCRRTASGQQNGPCKLSSRRIITDSGHPVCIMTLSEPWEAPELALLPLSSGTCLKHVPGVPKTEAMRQPQARTTSARKRSVTAHVRDRHSSLRGPEHRHVPRWAEGPRVSRAVLQMTIPHLFMAVTTITTAARVTLPMAIMTQ